MSATRKRHQGNNKSRNKDVLPQKSSSNCQQKANSSTKPRSCRPDLSVLQAVIRLLVILVKGFCALVILAILFNLLLVIINKAVLSGAISRYIPSTIWKDILSR